MIAAPAPKRILVVLTASFLAVACSESRSQQPAATQEISPRRILLTNDNGIDDRATLALARALAEESEVYLVAPATDRSGTSNFMPSVSRGRVAVEQVEVGPGITAFAVDGYPADCVVFALGGPMRARPPNLVVSGINGGPNLADAWVGSGTIGAARTAAYVGVPAVAVSGVEDDDQRAVDAVVAWVVSFLDSPVVRNLEAPEYLTVSLPVISPERIRGVEITTRARGLVDARAEAAATENGKEVWRLELSRFAGSAPPGSDVAAVQAGKIAVVPARAGEYDSELGARLREWKGEIPAWTAGDTAGATAN